MAQECSGTPGFNGVFLLFGVSVFLSSKLWPGMGVAPAQGHLTPAVLLQYRNSRGIWDRLSWGFFTFVFPGNLLRFNFLRSSVSLLRSFGPISVISEMNSWNNLDIFVQTQQR